MREPGISELTLDRTGGWTLVGGGGLDVWGRLIGEQGAYDVARALHGMRSRAGSIRPR